MTKSPERVLLLTDVFPSTNYSGAIVSAQICRFLLDANFSVHCACVRGVGVHEVFDDFLREKLPTTEFVKPTENCLEKDVYAAALAPIERDIVEYIKKNKIDTVWCPLQGESLLRILNAIITEVKDLKIITQLWDPFEWYLDGLKYPQDLKNDLLKMFDKVIRKSSCVLTASFPMNDYYKEKYHVPCFPVFASYPLPKNTVDKKSDPKNFTIVISGQTYAAKGINSLLSALEKMNWKYKNKTIVIKYFGSKPQIFKKYQSHVINKGYVSQAELVAEQSAADLLYCSYFFDSKTPKSVATQSYPSKIITYLASRTPILIHSEPDCPVYKDFEKYDCGFLLNSTDEKLVTEKLREIIDASPERIETIIKNSVKLHGLRFAPEKNAASVLKAFATERAKTPRVLEINNIDLPGRLWNGYDLMNHLNENTNFLVNQICTYKLSNNDDVVKIYKTQKELDLENRLLEFEANTLSVHSCLSASTPATLETSVYKEADLLHFHLIHNMKLSLFSLIEMCNEKPAIISIHDPWTFTGHCVHFGDCTKYLTGCENCPYLDIMFPLKFDTSHELWNLKKLIYENIDVDFVVSSQYMYDLFKSSPLTKNHRIHLIPFGIDINKFATVSKTAACKKYNIEKDDIVLFHRAQKEFKGTNYFVDALRQLKTDRKVTIITCSETGFFEELKSKYNVIELGNIGDEELAFAYNACDIFVMPSIGESFGMMSVEAMSCGKPVICFNNTALPSVTHAPECGIAVENLNSTKLMEAIKHLIEDEDDRLRRGKLAREIVRTTYNVDVYNEKTEKLYREVLARKHQQKNPFASRRFKSTTDVFVLKKKLNSLTKSLFPRSSKQRQTLLYHVPLKYHFKNPKIKYGDINVQLLLDQYNKDLYRLSKEEIKRSVVHRAVTKTAHFSRLFVSLLKNDRKTLLEVTKKRLHLK